MAFEDIKIGDRVIVNDNGKESEELKVVSFFYLIDMNLETCENAQEAINSADSDFFGVVIYGHVEDKSKYFSKYNGFGFGCESILLIREKKKEIEYTNDFLIESINRWRYKRAQNEISNPNDWSNKDLLFESQRLNIV